MATPAATLHPAGFNGGRRLKRALAGRPDGRAFFEGWYVKLVTADRTTRLALIPGMFLSEGGAIAESFVQVLDGESGETAYHRFDLSAFHADEREFDTLVGPNHFGQAGVRLDLPDLTGEVGFGPLDPWPVTLREPGAMGWYAWVPTMECYHGVVSLDHTLSGWIEHRGRRIELDGGRGYIEKDWGSAFPQAYVWMQSNHFEFPGVSLVASTALIPWRRTAFRGDLVALRLPARFGRDAGLHRFTTYTRARTTELDVSDTEVRWALSGQDGAQLTLQASTKGRSAGLLHAPVRTQMHQRVSETLGGRLQVRLVDRDGREVFSGVGRSAGIEVHGAIERLLATPGR